MQLLDKGSVVILYKSKPDFGHWTALLKTPEGIEYFDSYGNPIEGAKERIDSRFLKQTNQYENILAELLYDAMLSGIPIHYNQYKLQKRSKKISTCGKHVVVRILNRHLTIDEYERELKRIARANNISIDELVNSIYNQL